MQKRITSINIEGKTYQLEYWYQVSSLTVYSGTIFTDPETYFNFPVDRKGVIDVSDLIDKKPLYYSLLSVIEKNEKALLKSHRE